MSCGSGARRCIEVGARPEVGLLAEKALAVNGFAVDEMLGDGGVRVEV